MKRILVFALSWVVIATVSIQAQNEMAAEKENPMTNILNLVKDAVQGRDLPTGLTAHSLPFTIRVSEEKLEQVPDYMGPKNPIDMDFPYNPLMIDGEFWIIYRNGYVKPVLRYKGTNIENAVRQPDGSLNTPLRAPYMLGGMWYDTAEKNSMRRYIMKRDHTHLAAK